MQWQGLKIWRAMMQNQVHHGSARPGTGPLGVFGFFQ